MSKVLRTIWNIAKIIIWIIMIPVLMKLFGMWVGLLIFIPTVFIWSILATYLKVRKQDGQNKANEVLKIIFTTDRTLPFTAYGCYCSPKYGMDGRTNGIPPIDQLDSACYKHDNRCLEATSKLASGEITKVECNKLKNLADRSLMWEMITSKNSASGIYLISTEVGFLFRIIGRSLAKSA